MNQRGFSLLETMVALSVFSISAMGLLSLNTTSARTSAELDARLLARIVAETVVVDTVTGTVSTMDGETTGQMTQRNRTFDWTRTVEATPRAGLYSIRVEVTAADGDAVLARLSTLAVSEPGT